MRKALEYVLVSALTLIALVLLWQVRIAFVLFALSLGLAGALRPAIAYLTGRRLPRALSVAVVYSLTIAGILLVIWLVSGPVMKEVEQAAGNLSASYDLAKMDWPTNGTRIQQAVAEQLPTSAELYAALTGEQGMAALRGVLGAAQDLFTFLGSLAIILVLSLYWSFDQQKVERLTISLLPDESHEKARGIWRAIETGVGGYMRSELAQSLLTGLLLWLGYSVMGFQFPLLLALWAAVFRLIPWFGVLIAVLPLGAIALTGAPWPALGAIVYAAAVILGLKRLLDPLNFYRQRYSALIIVVFVIALADLFGFIGLILAPPLAVATQILVFELFPLPARKFSEETLQRAIQIRDRLRAIPVRTKPPLDESQAILVNRLRRILSRAIDYIQEY